MICTETTTRRILIADDEPAIRALLAQMLEDQGYSVTLACEGSEALALVTQGVPDLIILDVDMPGPSGFEVCEQLKEKEETRLVPVLILTGGSYVEGRVSAWGVGADDYLTKPFRVHDVLARVRSLLRTKALVDELDNAQAVAIAFSRAVEAKSPHTLGHTERVTSYATRLAERIGLDKAQRDSLKWGALLHDIGKISTPDEILNKPGRLTIEEMDVIRRHPLEGVRIVEPLRSLRDALPFIRWHHERLDGKGYPDGIFGGAIPLGVRVLAVADVYDAISSARPYRSAMPQSMCIEVLRKDAASGGLDPVLVESFIEMLIHEECLVGLS